MKQQALFRRLFNLARDPYEKNDVATKEAARVKTQNYEGGHRAALFVRWPNGKLRSPADVDTPAQAQDILPTLIDLLKLKKPATASFDGQSIAGLLRESPRGSSQPFPDRKFVVQYGQAPKKWDSAVIWNKWRLVNGDELYDLKSDPAQANNVAAQQPEIFQQMRRHYERWWAGVEPRLNEFYHISNGGGLGRCLLRQRRQLRALRTEQKRRVASVGRTKRKLRNRIAALAERSRRRHHGRHAGIQKREPQLARRRRLAHR
ncbi:MAG: hypothetical protein ACREEM_16790 [Blastocatellia bacterium]